MFCATFIGHQGWLLSSNGWRLLVDPLLTDAFGHAGVVGQLFPPRVLNLTAFPPINAVLITHEHEDHFNVPSLNRLDRAIPILLSSRSSSAARTCLAEMGFTVQLVSPGENVVIGDLELMLFSPDHVKNPASDEWDVVQYLVRDRSQDGSFFSYVDAPVSTVTDALLRQSLAEPGLWAHANNSIDLSLLQVGEGPPNENPADTGAIAQGLMVEAGAKRNKWRAPVANLMCGGGFSFQGDLAWLNSHVFWADSERACAAMAVLFPDERFIAPTPGQTFKMSKGKWVGTDETTEFLHAQPRQTWPLREAHKAEQLQEYAPACGRTELSDPELDELIDRLSELAGYLYAKGGFKRLYSRHEAKLGDRKAAFVLQLIADADGGAYVLEYLPHACAFELVESAEPLAEYAFGIECWGTDLLALFRGEFGPTGIVFGRGRSWSFGSEALTADFGMFGVLWEFFHPLRRPKAFIDLYRKLLAQEPSGVVRVPAAPRSDFQTVVRAPLNAGETE